jgi:hypothetical protein
MVVLTTPMNFSSNLQKAAVTALPALLCALTMRPDALPHARSRMDALPATTLWSWERREDLRRADVRRLAIAYLDQTVTIDLNVHRTARRNAIVFPEGVIRIAVVRIEPARFAVLDAANREEAVGEILRSAEEPGVAALQIDFDATVSQREFYRDVLERVRERMPAAMPLSMTALASWCSYDDWLRGLPVDEAVPMMFRMEPDRRRAPADLDAFAIREPLCRGAVGVSTSEPWPSRLRGKRVYVFADEGWRGEDLSELERRMR